MIFKIIKQNDKKISIFALIIIKLISSDYYFSLKS